MNSKKTNLEALKRFLKEAKGELKKEDYKSLEVSLRQALGRVKNLRMLEDLENAN